VTQALDLVDGWLAQPNAVIVHPGRRHASIVRELLEATGSGGNLTTDAHLAALAIEHGAEIQTADSDFHRFAGLRWSNPLRP
jgi:predicted nucleic acid-binding protein